MVVTPKYLKLVKTLYYCKNMGYHYYNSENVGVWLLVTCNFERKNYGKKK